MVLYAKDAQETDRPWELWERFNPISRKWLDLNDNPTWCAWTSYRRKQKFIIVNGLRVTAPVAHKLNEGTVYWIPCTSHCSARKCEWNNTDHNQWHLDYGLVYLTEEEAQMRLDAMLKPTRQNN